MTSKCQHTWIPYDCYMNANKTICVFLECSDCYKLVEAEIDVDGLIINDLLHVVWSSDDE